MTPSFCNSHLAHRMRFCNTVSLPQPCLAFWAYSERENFLAICSLACFSETSPPLRFSHASRGCFMALAEGMVFGAFLVIVQSFALSERGSFTPCRGRFANWCV